MLPTLAPSLRYDTLPGVRDGSMAMDAYLEAISPATTQERKAAIQGELLAYCALDTLAMVKIWRSLSSPTKENPMSTPSENTPQTQFFADLMQHLMAGAMIPKVQVERSLGPIIGFFIASALSTKLGEDIVMLCPEFPIRKEGNNQSTNIDWLLFSRTKQDLLLVELKTTDTSFTVWQAKVYEELQNRIAGAQSAAFLASDLLDIADESLERGKYLNVQKLAAAGLGVAESEMGDAFGRCKQARVIYLAPAASHPQQGWRPDWLWLSFADLPPTLNNHPHADQWPAIRNSLIGLDTLTRRLRNGEDASDSGKNYAELIDFDEALKRCQSSGASVVLGMVQWRAELPGMLLELLRARKYKIDSADKPTGGKKLARNWIPGDQFLAQVMGKMEFDMRSKV